MLRRFASLAACLAFAAGSLPWAADDIYLKGLAKKIDGNVTVVTESAKEVTVKGAPKPKYLAEEIEDIFYETPTSPVLGAVAYRSGFMADREFSHGTDPKKRVTAYSEALDKYTKAYGQLTDKRAKTHVEFRMAYLRARKALEDNADAKTAAPSIAALRAFCSSHANAWQVTRGLMLLAKLQMDVKDFAGAAESYATILKLDVPEEVKNDARLQGALADVQVGKHAIAEGKFNQLLKTLPKGTKTYGRALVGLSECLIAANKNEEAIDLLKKAIKESDDKSMRAVAYNTLGVNFYKADQFREARWEFLWVDVVYNQDKAEHARALYYLSHIFDKLADPDKALQMRSALLEATYAGTEFQRKMIAEQKGK